MTDGKKRILPGYCTKHCHEEQKTTAKREVGARFGRRQVNGSESVSYGILFESPLNIFTRFFSKSGAEGWRRSSAKGWIHVLAMV